MLIPCQSKSRKVDEEIRPRESSIAQRGENIRAIAHRKDDRELLVASSGAGEDLQIGATMFATGTERQIFMHDRDALSLAEPRQVVQAFLQRVPVPTEVAGKPEPICQNFEQLLLAAHARGNTHNECGITTECGRFLDKPKGEGRGV